MESSRVHSFAMVFLAMALCILLEAVHGEVITGCGLPFGTPAIIGFDTDNSTMDLRLVQQTDKGITGCALQSIGVKDDVSMMDTWVSFQTKSTSCPADLVIDKVIMMVEWTDNTTSPHLEVHVSGAWNATWSFRVHETATDDAACTSLAGNASQAYCNSNPKVVDTHLVLQLQPGTSVFQIRALSNTKNATGGGALCTLSASYVWQGSSSISVASLQDSPDDCDASHFATISAGSGYIFAASSSAGSVTVGGRELRTSLCFGFMNTVTPGPVTVTPQPTPSSPPATPPSGTPAPLATPSPDAAAFEAQITISGSRWAAILVQVALVELLEDQFEAVLTTKFQRQANVTSLAVGSLVVTFNVGDVPSDPLLQSTLQSLAGDDSWLVDSGVQQTYSDNGGGETLNVLSAVEVVPATPTPVNQTQSPSASPTPSPNVSTPQPTLGSKIEGPGCSTACGALVVLGVVAVVCLIATAVLLIRHLVKRNRNKSSKAAKYNSASPTASPARYSGGGGGTGSQEMMSVAPAVLTTPPAQQQQPGRYH